MLERPAHVSLRALVTSQAARLSRYAIAWIEEDKEWK